MTLNESKKLLEDMYDALNAQDLEAQHKYWHDNMVWHGPPGFGIFMVLIILSIKF